MKANIVKVIAEAMLEKKGQEVVSLNFKKIPTAIADHFVICHADSSTNVSAIADNVEDQVIVNCKRKVLRQQGRENNLWIILDYGDVMVHVFQTQYRSFYKLEELWADAKRTDYKEED